MGPPAGTIREASDRDKPWRVSNIGSPRMDLADELMLFKADFRNLDNGTFISNIVSQGQDEKDLYLTFYFKWPFPQIEAGSTEEKETSDKLWAMAKDSVQATIDHTRQFVKEGKIGAA